MELQLECFWLWQKINGAVFKFREQEVLLCGEFAFLDFLEATRHYKATFYSGSDDVIPLDDVLPIFLSHWNERLGPIWHGRDVEIYEVSLSLQPARIAFSSLETALQIFAAYFLACQNPLVPELETFLRIHQEFDAQAAESYWI